MTNLATFGKFGFSDLGVPFDPSKCAEALSRIKELRYFGPDLFMTEEQYRSGELAISPSAAPLPNLLDQCDLSFIEENEGLVNTLTELLGPDYRLYAKRAICGIPSAWVPSWVVDEINTNHPPNLSVFFKPEFRNLRHFMGADFHMDLIDFDDREPDMITMYVYLDQVTDADAPIVVLTGSHFGGADAYPHNVKRSGDTWSYTTDEGLHSEHQHVVMTGELGRTYIWHGCLLHGTLPVTGSLPRISLRYIFEQGSAGQNTLLDKINGELSGRKSNTKMVDFSKQKTDEFRTISQLLGADAVV